METKDGNAMSMELGNLNPLRDLEASLEDWQSKASARPNPEADPVAQTLASVRQQLAAAMEQAANIEIELTAAQYAKLRGMKLDTLHPPAGRFEGIIGGPPCQLYSAFRHINPHVGRHGDMIPEYERIVAEAQPGWFVMENVEAAPVPAVAGYHVHAQMLRDDWVGGATERKRRFSFGTRAGLRLQIEQLALHNADPNPAVTSASEAIPVALGGSGKPKKSLAKHGGRGSRSVGDMLEDQGLPRDFLSDCPLTAEGTRRMIGNGVPLPMGRAVARAVKRALEPRASSAA